MGCGGVGGGRREMTRILPRRGSRSSQVDWRPSQECTKNIC